MKYVMLAVDAALISNVAISYFLGLCPLPDIGKDRKRAGFSALALVLITTISSLLYGLVYQKALSAKGAGSLRALVSVVIVLAVSFLVSKLLSRPAGTENDFPAWLTELASASAVLGTVLAAAEKNQDPLSCTIYGLFAALGYLAVFFVLWGIEDRMEYNDIPKSFRGMPILLASAGLMAIAFHGLEMLG